MKMKMKTTLGYMNMKPILSIVCSLLIATNLCAEEQHKPISEDQTKVTSVSVPDDIRTSCMLSGSHVWQFSVKVPPHLVWYYVVLERYRNGEQADRLMELTAVMGPDERDTWQERKLYISISPADSDSGATLKDSKTLIYRDALGTTETLKNPFYGTTCVIEHSPTQIDDNTYRLMRAENGGAELRIRIYADKWAGRVLEKK
jgi:hypothetical protein